MSTLVALTLATPLWGFALRAPVASPEVVADAVVLAGVSAASPEQEAHNASMMELTRWLQLTATVGIGATAVLGAIQFRDEYGFHDAYSETACATGDAILDYCGESTPWPHLIAALSAAGVGIGAFVASTQVDYALAARRDSDWRIFEVTRWIGVGMYVVQAIGGFFLANSIRFGWADEQRDFDTLQGFAIAHLSLAGAIVALETFNTVLLF